VCVCVRVCVQCVLCRHLSADNAEQFLERAVEFCNTQVYGSLSLNIVVKNAFLSFSFLPLLSLSGCFFLFFLMPNTGEARLPAGRTGSSAVQPQVGLHRREQLRGHGGR
jgi:hypothetical protein